MTKSIGGLVLAAGMSSRMGKFKPLLPLGEKAIIQRTVESLLKADIEDVVVVLGKNAKQVKEALLSYDVIFAVNEDYEKTDMLTSIQIGLAHCGEKEAVFVLPADMPLVYPETLQRMKEFFCQGTFSVVYPVYKGKRGHPPLIAKKWFSKIENYSGQGGLRSVLAEAQNGIGEIETEDSGCVLDADFMHDYEKLQKVWNFVRNFSNKISLPKADLQTVDKVGAGDNLQHHFSLKNVFSFNKRQILWIVEVFSFLLASILASFFRFIHAKVSPAFISIRAFSVYCV